PVAPAHRRGGVPAHRARLPPHVHRRAAGRRGGPGHGAGARRALLPGHHRPLRPASRAGPPRRRRPPAPPASPPALLASTYRRYQYFAITVRITGNCALIAVITLRGRKS